MKCSQCGYEFDRTKDEGWVASISGSIMGDEYIETYYYCEKCGKYTQDNYRDRFLGDTDIFPRGPYTQEEVEASIELIKKCPEPWNKKCRCDAHIEYFGGSLD